MTLNEYITCRGFTLQCIYTGYDVIKNEWSKDVHVKILSRKIVLILSDDYIHNSNDVQVQMIMTFL